MNVVVVSAASLAMLGLVHGATFVIGRRIGRWHMVGKSAGKGGDPRYDTLLHGDFSATNVLRKVFLLQAAMTWFMSLPLQVSAAMGPTSRKHQPHYFGGPALWWGLWLVGIAGRPSLLTVLSPVAMTYFLICGTGARLTERIVAGRPGYSEYRARTSFFVPWPPRSSMS